MGGATAARRPTVENLLLLKRSDIRPHVKPGDGDYVYQEVPLRLHWRFKSKGCFGPTSSAAINRRKQIPRVFRKRIQTHGDRGCTGGWHLYLICPGCSRTCEKLFSLRACKPAWACRLCHNATYKSCNRPGRRNGSKGPDYFYHKHKDAAIRIRRDYLGMTPLAAAAFKLRPAIDIQKKPTGISKERFESLKWLATGHESLAQLAHLDMMEARYRGWGFSTNISQAERAQYIAFAENLIHDSVWATRQGTRAKA